MKILGIETSCDETAICVLEASGGLEASSDRPKFRVLSSVVLSQAKLHEKYGGVFPNLAKREHVKNIVPILEAALKEADLFKEKTPKSAVSNSKEKSPIFAENFDKNTLEKVRKILEREEGLYEKLVELLSKIEKPSLDHIAVTYGPGLEPALWVGMNTARALGLLWGIPVIPINHMEGHICSVLLGAKTHTGEWSASILKFPTIALLISGGHTELVLIEDWMKYRVVGETKDDAVGEAFDKVARMLGLPYPGGPEISRLAEEERHKELEIKAQNKEGSYKNDPENEQLDHTAPFHFPRPMLNTNDLNFSFSGLKTSVLYTIKKIPDLNDTIKRQIARAFEDAVVQVLVKKTEKAIENYQAKSLLIAGGVVANKAIVEAFKELIKNIGNKSEQNDKGNSITLFIPSSGLSGDNAVMIALCAFVHIAKKTDQFLDIEKVKATGNLRL